MSRVVLFVASLALGHALNLKKESVVPVSPGYGLNLKKESIAPLSSMANPWAAAATGYMPSMGSFGKGQEEFFQLKNTFEQEMQKSIQEGKDAKGHPGRADHRGLHHKVDKWADCGEAIAYWGEGKDRTTCECKPDPAKKPIKDTLTGRLELLEHSPMHKWKVNATKEIEWKGQFYINLPLSTKRRDFIETQLKSINDHHKGKIQTHRWSATDPHQAQKANLKEFSDKGLNDYVKAMGDREKWGTIGTYLSHLRLLRRIWMNDKEGEGLYVIMEDDGTLEKNWHTKVEGVLNAGEVPKDWDMLKFGYWGLTRCEDEINGAVYEARPPIAVAGTTKSYYNGNLGYIVRPKSIPAILAAIRDETIYDVDGVFVDLFRDNATAADYGIHSYYLKHSLVKGGTGGQLLATDRLGGALSKYSLQQKEQAMTYEQKSLLARKKAEEDFKNHAAKDEPKTLEKTAEVSAPHSLKRSNKTGSLKKYFSHTYAQDGSLKKGNHA